MIGRTKCGASLGFDPLLREYYTFAPEDVEHFQPHEGERPSANPRLTVAFRSISGGCFAGCRHLAIPLEILSQPCFDNWVYRITFGPASDDARAILSHSSFEAFRAKSGGYVGMTSRPNPLTRFDEHFSKARNGTGHLLHKAWRSLSDLTEISIQMTLCANTKTRQAAFDVEEQLVDDLGTITPGGLNVIAGGMKGIREMWRLGLMSRAENPTDNNRERALELLESKRSPVSAHYRSGHMRILPERCSKRTTWVSPCWVGMKVSENA